MPDAPDPGMDEEVEFGAILCDPHGWPTVGPVEVPLSMIPDDDRGNVRADDNEVES